MAKERFKVVREGPRSYTVYERWLWFFWVEVRNFAYQHHAEDWINHKLVKIPVRRAR